MTKGEREKQKRLELFADAKQFIETNLADENRFFDFQSINEEDIVEIRLKKWKQETTPTAKFRDEGIVEASYREAFLYALCKYADFVIDELRPIALRMAELIRVLSEERIIGLTTYARSALARPGLELRSQIQRTPNPLADLDRLWIAGEIWTEINDLVEILADPNVRSIGELPSLIKRNWKLIDEGMRGVDQAFREASILDLSLQREFLRLIGLITAWARKFNLQRDWIIEHSFFYLKQFVESPSIGVTDLRSEVRSAPVLRCDPFDFTTEWRPYEETKREFEKRVLDKQGQLAVLLREYVKDEEKRLNLCEKSQQTKPIQFGRVKWLVRWTVQGWDQEQILDEIYADRLTQGCGQEGCKKWCEKRECDKSLGWDTVRSAFAEMNAHGLPVREHYQNYPPSNVT